LKGQREFFVAAVMWVPYVRAAVIEKLAANIAKRQVSNFVRYKF
jgi:hypothetical protein